MCTLSADLWSESEAELADVLTLNIWTANQVIPGPVN